MSQPYTRLKGVTNVREDTLTQNLTHGLISYFQWGFLGIGGFQNITHSPAISGSYGGKRSRLRCVDDPRFNTGQVWEGYRGDWVWETGIEYGVQPVRPSGYWVDSVFHPLSATGVDYVDYKRGRIVLGSGIATSAVVETDFSHRFVTFVDAESPWSCKLMLDANHIERADFLAMSSGNWAEISDVRYQLPIVAVEVVQPRHTGYTPYQIGGGQWVYKDVLFHIFAETKEDKDQIKDIIEFQNDGAVRLVDRGKLKASPSGFPPDLDYKGALVASPLQYPQLVEVGQYLWNTAWFSNNVSQTLSPINNWLYRAVVRTTITLAMENI